MNAAGEAPASATTISCYRHGVPPFVRDALASRYETLHSSWPFFAVCRSVDDVGCYVAWRDGRPTDIFVFSCTERRLVVLNEMIDIEPGELKRFADYVFAHFPELDMIRFEAVRTCTDGLGLPVQRYNAKDTYVISLPATPDDYLAGLGKSTRATLRARINGAQKKLPSFATRFMFGAEIDEDTVRTIVRLSEQRITGKGVPLKHDIDRIMALSRACGFVTVLLVEGSLCAGSISYRIGGSVFGEVIAYDPAYERFGLGSLCVYHAICESIRMGARNYYLGGGAFAFKERMAGQRVDMDRLQVYRSYGKLVRHLDSAAAVCASGSLRRLKKALHERKGSPLADLAFKLFHSYRSTWGK